VIASGNLTHNLRDCLVAAQAGGHTPAYVREFADWMCDRLAARDIDGLLDDRRAIPAAARAHPTEEHLLPRYVALGAGGKEFTAERIHAGIDDYVLAMDAFAFTTRTGAPA
jgi:4,5-DOPA dioxygenase extradiol